MQCTQLTLTIAVGVLLALSDTDATANAKGWLVEFETAKKKAASNNKDIIMNFCGSDW